MSVKVIDKIPIFTSRMESSIEKSMGQIGDIVRDKAKDVVRVDTGRLKRSLKSVVDNKESENTITLQIGSKKTAEGDTTGSNNDNAHYALFQESGLPGTTPYLLPSIHTTIPSIQGIFKKNGKI